MSGKSEEMKRFVNDVASSLFGTTLKEAFAAKVCVSCGKPAVDFKDALSRREYGLSGLCGPCQDETFGE